MHYDVTQLILIGLILGVSGIGQSAVGFGYALFAIAPLVWIGIPLPSTIALVSTCTAIQTALGSYRLRAEVPWSLVVKASAVRVSFILIGLLTLRYLLNDTTIDMKGVVGGALCVMVLAQMLWQPRPVDAMHMGLGVLAWITSGFLNGICGMGGPPLVLWAMAHTWSSDKTRGFLFAIFVLCSPLQLALLVFTFGTDILWSVALGILLFPVVYLGYRLGMPLGSRMDKAKLRRVALSILLVIGAAALVQMALQ